MNNYFAELELIAFSKKADKVYDLIVLLDKPLASYEPEAQDLCHKIIKSIQSIKNNLTYLILDYKKFANSANKSTKVMSFGAGESNQASTLLAPTLEQLQANPALKKQLWEQLQVFIKV